MLIWLRSYRLACLSTAFFISLLLLYPPLCLPDYLLVWLSTRLSSNLLAYLPACIFTGLSTLLLTTSISLPFNLNRAAFVLIYPHPYPPASLSNLLHLPALYLPFYLPASFILASFIGTCLLSTASFIPAILSTCQLYTCLLIYLRSLYLPSYLPASFIPASLSTTSFIPAPLSTASFIPASLSTCQVCYAMRVLLISSWSHFCPLLYVELT